MGHPTFETLRISATIYFFVTFIVTSYRCFARFSRKIWGYDDSVVLFSMLAFISYLIGTSILARASLSRGQRIAGFYLMVFGFNTPVWGGRISIVLTVFRVTPWQRQKNILLFVVAFFVILYLLLLLQAYWVCEITHPEWKNIPGSICMLAEAIPITQIVTTVVSDGILVLIPLLIIKGVRIPALRSRLLMIFSFSVATTAVSVTHAIMVIEKPGIMEAIFAGLEAAVSVIISSTSVILPAVLRALNAGDPFMQVDTVDPGMTTGVEIVRCTTLTRIELGINPRTARVVAVAGGESLEEAFADTTPQERDLGDPDEKRDKKHLLTTKDSDDSLWTSITTKVPPLSECDITESRVRSLPAVGGDAEVDVEREKLQARRKTT